LLLVSMSLASCSSGDGGHGGHSSSSGHGNKPTSHGGKTAGHGTAGKTHSTHTPADAADLLDLLAVGGSQDPSRFVEVEIGTFRVTHKLADQGEPLVVKFRLFGIVSESKEGRLHDELAKYEKRIRDAVISLVQKTEAEQLAEPGLKWLKAELVAAINRVVQDRALSCIAFSDFSLEEV
jgi:hypothetical protein